MSIFDLHSQVLADYRDFVRSFFIVADERARQFVEHALVEEARLWPDFLLQVSPAYGRAATVDVLAAQGVLHDESARIFRTPEGNPFHLYQHQIEAIEKAHVPESYVVTSGTGSGKSLTYFLPIVDSLVWQPAPGDGVAVLVVYPMNALVNSQLQSLETLKRDYERRTGRDFPVTFAKFTGETSDAVREGLRQHPPQILLTNYVMAELLLVRPEDQRFMDRAGGGLQFLVFDELHTLPRPAGSGRRHAHPTPQGALRGAQPRARGHQRHDGRKRRRHPRGATCHGCGFCQPAVRTGLHRRAGDRGNTRHVH